ncbi:DUF393 domain-containing protein [Shewanella cyperi]|uniref:DUF393 domain-containing protein n=1 Tax=Shewanella cyperi TaxID=2814292 RepID=A0A975AKC2_9GAMM|nr:DUF393 domain-containing protein [Shewanella cyperi]QSX29043.1 DUF393 domain-containing protein [Shewanella cyperi]
MAQKRLTVYYDGACPTCVRDRANYEKLAGKQGAEVEWFDITGKEQQLCQLGIDPKKALRELHVRDEQQQLHVEMDAYILLMQRVWLLKPLAWFIGLPFIRPWLSRLYHKMVSERLERTGRG